MQKEYSKEELWKIYDKLPEELKEVIFSEGTSDNIFNICSRNGIADERISKVAKYVGRVLMGLLPPNEFLETLEKELKLEKEISKLMQDEDVTRKSGVYQYVLTRDEKYLNLRAFTDKMKRESYERQKGVCPKCKKKFEIDEMEADHIKLWSEGGKTIAENCQMLCKDDHREKSKK